MDSDDERLNAMMPRVRGIARKAMRPGSDLEDLTQEALIQAWRNLNDPTVDRRSESIDRFLGWCSSSLYLAARDEAVHRSSLKVSGRGRPPMSGLPDLRKFSSRSVALSHEGFDISSFGNPLEAFEARHDVAFALGLLSGMGVTLVSLIYGLDDRGPMKLDRAARIVGVSWPTARKSLHRTLESMREIIEGPSRDTVSW